KANAQGVWTFRPSTQLSPGNHTITITTKDASGVIRTITQQFVVFASGTQVSVSAPPSASITPSITPSPPPTALPTKTTTPTPTTITPTPTTVEVTPTLLP